jgi:hypothetical protein
VVPVEILFVPGTNPPVAYVTVMFGNTLWTATWNPQSREFDVAQAHDFNGSGSSVPLEIYFGPKAERLYVTTANPGHFHIFDISKDPAKPELLKTIKTAAGAHHVGFTKDWKYGFVQNAFINLSRRFEERESCRFGRYPEEQGLQPQLHRVAAEVEPFGRALGPSPE